MIDTVILTKRLKIKPDVYPWLNMATSEVNQVWNWANEQSKASALRSYGDKRQHWLTGYDLCYLTTSGSKWFDHINAQTLQQICHEFASKRDSAKRPALRWRISGGSKRSLGWVPFNSQSIKRTEIGIRFAGKHFRLFNRSYLPDDVKLGDGCFAQDSVGDWWFCVPIKQPVKFRTNPDRQVGIDLGLKDLAVLSDGNRIEACRAFRDNQVKLGQAQRCGHKQRVKHLHRQIARQRSDYLHKASRHLVEEYGFIAVGDLNAKALQRRFGKSSSDSAIGMFKTMLQYKGQQTGSIVMVINESYTTRVCGNCGSLSGPKGVGQLVVRDWVCADCGSAHDRDINSAINILSRARALASVSGNEHKTRRQSRRLAA